MATTTAKKTFEQWLKEVDDAIRAKCGMSYLDLADVPYYDWYEAKVKPATAASGAIKNDRVG